MKKEFVNMVRNICEIGIYFAIVALCLGLYFMIVFSGLNDIKVILFGFEKTMIEVALALMMSGALSTVFSMTVLLLTAYFECEELEEDCFTIEKNENLHFK